MTEVHGRTFFAVAISDAREWRGLIRVHRRGRFGRFRIDPHIPFGWTKRKAPDRNAWLVMPLWLVPAWLLVARWPGWLLGPLALLGFWDLPSDGCYYHEGRWNWRWWRGMDRQLQSMRHIDPALTTVMHNRNWFQRFGWWIERRFLTQWADRMPMWPK